MCFFLLDKFGRTQLTMIQMACLWMFVCSLDSLWMLLIGYVAVTGPTVMCEVNDIHSEFNLQLNILWKRALDFQRFLRETKFMDCENSSI